MRHNDILTAMFVLGAACLAGCVSSRSQESFQQIDENVAHRTGRSITWRQFPAETEQPRAEALHLLESGLGLDDAVKIALLQNPKLQILYETVGIAEAEVVKAMLPPNPVVEVGYTQIGGNRHSWEFNLVQELVGVIMIPRQKRMARADAELMQSRVTAGVLDLILEVKIAYRRVQAAQQTLEVLQQTLKSDQAAYEMAERLREAGNISRLEQQGYKAVLEQTKLTISNAELKLAETRENLNVLLGINQDLSHWELTETLPAVNEDRLDAEQIEAAARQSSLDLEMARLDLLGARRRWQIVNFTSVLPSLELALETERTAGGDWDWGPLLTFPLPIFYQGQTERTIANAKARRAASLERMIMIQLGAVSRLTAINLETRRQQVLQYQNTVIPLKIELTEETHKHFNAMQVGVFDLLAAKQEELTAKRNHIEVLAEYWIARAQADHLMSGRMPRNENSRQSYHEVGF